MSDLASRHRRLISGASRGLGAAAARAALGAVAVGYGAVCAWRNHLYNVGLLRVHRAPVPVVSVGNLTLGGTGKTPMVEFLASQLAEAGCRVAILSRGYGAEPGKPNDEAMLLARNLPQTPHIQGGDRVASARKACDEHNSDVLILDDGFQHRRLRRDLDIVLIDALRPFGFGRLFPRGLLREPLRSLRRADLLVATRADLAEPGQLDRIRRQVRARAGEKPWVECAHAPDRLEMHDGRAEPIESLRGRAVAAFAGIGNPEAFWRTVRQTGCRLVGQREFADHHGYGAPDVEALGRWANELGAEMLVTTQKDLVKLAVPTVGALPLWALRIQLRVLAGADILDEHLNRIRAQAGASR